MSDEELEDANERIASPPPVDQAPTRFLGLFVVGHLAKRHGIEVKLLEGAESGIMARLTVPANLLISEEPEVEQSPLATDSDLDAELAGLTNGELPMRDAPVEPPAPDFDDLPVRGDSDDLPVRGESDDLPVRGDSDDLPVRGESDDLPVRGDLGDLPVRGDSATTPDLGDLPVRGDDVFAALQAGTQEAESVVTDLDDDAEVSDDAELDNIEELEPVADLDTTGEIEIDANDLPGTDVPGDLPVNDLPIRGETPASDDTSPLNDLPVRGETLIEELNELPTRPEESSVPADFGLPTRAPLETLRETGAVPLEPVVATASAREQDPEDLSDSASAFGSMMSAFTTGVQRGVDGDNAEDN